MRTFKIITMSSLVALSGFFIACAEEADSGSPDATGGAQSASGGVGGSGGAGSATGGATTGGLGGEPGTGGTTEQPQGVPFYPEGIEVEYVGQGPTGGLELIAFTLVQKVGFLEKPAMYVAVKNTGLDPICLVDVPVSFLD